MSSTTFTASLQDLVPWSIIYGEQNRRHGDQIREMCESVLLDYAIDRLNRGWREKRPCKFFSYALQLCLDRRLIAGEDIQRTRVRMIAKYDGQHMDTIDYYLDYLLDYLQSVKG